MTTSCLMCTNKMDMCKTFFTVDCLSAKKKLTHDQWKQCLLGGWLINCRHTSNQLNVFGRDFFTSTYFLLPCKIVVLNDPGPRPKSFIQWFKDGKSFLIISSSIFWESIFFKDITPKNLHPEPNVFPKLLDSEWFFVSQIETF